MEILILHLSDIHLRPENNPILEKLESLKNAVTSIEKDLKAFFIVYTGDITFSGKEPEFNQAEELYLELTSKIEDSLKDVPMYSVFVPGNHDCNFETNMPVRDLVIKEFVGTKETKELDHDFINIAIAPQENFFNFLKNVAEDHPKDKIYWTHTFEIFEHTIQFNCFNTAWMSSKNEAQGTLLIPPQIQIDSDKSSLAISIFHHPYNWLESNNGRIFRNLLESCSDLILTGHEHTPSLYTKSNSTSTKIDYYEGGVLNDSANPNNSSFNVVIINLNKKEQKKLSYLFNNGIYKEDKSHSTNWLSFNRNPALLKNSFQLNQTFLRFLDDYGTPLSHPRKSPIYLEDLFIYPKLKLMEAQQKDDLSSDSDNIIQSDEVESLISNNQNILIFGEQYTGKTALAKTLFKFLRTKDIFSIFINGESLTPAILDKKHLDPFFKDKFFSHYENTEWELYQQLDCKQKCLIIDDFHLSKLNNEGKTRFLELTKNYFDKTIIFSDETLKYEKLELLKTKDSFIFDYKLMEILPFGNFLRGLLVEKWILLGQEHLIKESDLTRESHQNDRTLKAILNSNMIPPFPFFIVTMLQQFETNRSHILTTGSYGELFDFLINDKLGESSLLAAAISTINTYLSELAFFLFNKELPFLTETEMKAFHEQHTKKYAVSLDYQKIKDQLLFCSILSSENFNYSFKYKFSYYYFLAKYIADHFHDANIQPIFKSLSENLHREDYANIYIYFLVTSQKIPS